MSTKIPGDIEQILCAVASYYDDPARARQMLGKCLYIGSEGGRQDPAATDPSVAWRIASRDGDEFDLKDFAAMQKRGYERRCKYDTPHNINILWVELMLADVEQSDEEAEAANCPALVDYENPAHQHFDKDGKRIVDN